MTIKKNFFWKISASLLGGGINFIFMIYLMRRLAPTEYGELAFALSAAGLFSIFVDYGFNPLITRDLGRAPQKGFSYFLHIMKAKAAIAVLAGVLLVGLSCLYPPMRAQIPLLVVAFAYLVSVSFVETGQSLSYVYSEFRQGAVLFVSHRFLVALLGTLAVAGGLAALRALGGMATGGLVGALLTLAYFLLRNAPAWRAHSPEVSITQLARSALPLLFQSVFIVIYFRIDTVLLGWLRGNTETGLYNGAYRFFEVANIVPTAYIAAIAARYSQTISKSHWGSVFLKHLAVCVALGVLGCLTLQVIAFGLSTFFLTNQYRASEPILRILGLGLLFLYPNYLFTTTLIYLNRQTATAKIAALCVLFNAGFNCWIIPRWAGMGAAWMTVATEALISVLSLLLILPVWNREPVETTGK